MLYIDTVFEVHGKVAGCYVSVLFVVCTIRWMLCVDTFCDVCAKVVGCFVWIRSVVCAGKKMIVLCRYVLWSVQQGSCLLRVDNLCDLLAIL